MHYRKLLLIFLTESIRFAYRNMKKKYEVIIIILKSKTSDVHSESKKSDNI